MQRYVRKTKFPKHLYKNRCTVNERNFWLSSQLHILSFLCVLSCVMRLWIPCYTLGTWMVFHQCGFFQEFSNYLRRWTSFHTLSSWISVDSFMCLWITGLCKFLATLRAAECFIISVDSFGVFKWPACVNCLSHFEQLNGFSSVWILSWVIKLWSRLNFFEQIEQLNGLLLVCI